MYIVYISNGGKLANENEITEIIGVYNSYEKAYNQALSLEKENIDNFDYVEDEEDLSLAVNETEKDSKSGSIRMFYEYQENWDRYFEIHIEKVEVE